MGDNETSTFAQQFGGRGGFIGRGRSMQRGNYGYNRGYIRGAGRGRSIAPPKYPMDQDAFEKAMGKLKPGQQPPNLADCPLGCQDSLPYGSAELCPNFEKKTLLEKQDIVKKNQLCRKCLKRPRIPHLARDCRAPNCGKCGGEHNTSICPNPTGTQEIHSTQREITGDLYNTDDIYGEQNESMVQALVQQDEQFSQSQGYEQHMIAQGTFDKYNEIYQQSIQAGEDYEYDNHYDNQYNYSLDEGEEPETWEFKIEVESQNNNNTQEKEETTLTTGIDNVNMIKLEYEKNAD